MFATKFIYDCVFGFQDPLREINIIELCRWKLSIHPQREQGGVATANSSTLALTRGTMASRLYFLVTRSLSSDPQRTFKKPAD